MPGWLVAVVAAAGLGLSVRWFEQLNLYFPSKGLFATPKVLGLPFEDVGLDLPDAKLHGWYVPPKSDTAPVILFTHGNGGNISSRLDKLAILNRLGVGVLMFDYRGYGQSTGRPSEKGLYADAEAFYGWLTKEKGVAPERIVLHGESLGGAVAAELATRAKAGGLILESSFTSTVEMGKAIFPILPVKLMVSQKFDTISKAPRLNLPALVMHSQEDEIIPYRMGRQLFDALPGPKEFAELRGDHNEGFLISGELYPTAIAGFLTRRVSGPTPKSK